MKADHGSLSDFLVVIIEYQSSLHVLAKGRFFLVSVGPVRRSFLLRSVNMQRRDVWRTSRIKPQRIKPLITRRPVGGLRSEVALRRL
jgi:hypothetical protein